MTRFQMRQGVSLLALSIGVATAAPAFAADLRGQVTDASSHVALPGATVEVDGASVTAGPDGRFAISGLSAGDHKLVIDYVGYGESQRSVTLADGAPTQLDIALGAAPAAAGGGGGDEVVVTGQRAAERRSLQTKKVADNIVEALYANDVGKLPDQNVAEAVRRLPGVSVANDQGEGRYVIIRGVNPNLANVTLNGQTAPAPEPEGRQVKLDDIPSSLIGRVEVIKSLTPDLDANAIAGQVDIGTISAFDRHGTFFNARGAYGRYEMNDKSPYEGDATVGGTFGADKQFGAVVSANYSFRPIESQNFGASAPTYRLVNGFLVPDMQNIRDYNLERKRTGAVAAFDWRPDDQTSLYARLLYSKFTDHETRDQFRIDNESAFTGQTATTGAFKGRGGRYVRRRQEDDNTRTFAFGGTFHPWGGELKVDGAWSRAEKTDPLRSEWLFRTGGSALNVTYDTGSRFYLFTPDANAYDAAKYNPSTVNYDHRQAVETLQQIRADYRLPLAGVGQDSGVKFGVKLMDRKKTNNRDYQAYTATGFTLADTNPFTSPVSIYDGRYVMGPRVNYDGVQAYVTAHPGVLTLTTASTLTNSLVNDYEAHEKLYAGYVMADLHFDKLTLIPGVRVEAIKGDYKAKKIVAGSTVSDPFNVAGDFSHTDVFPGVNARYDVSRDLVLRAAATTSIGRANYADLAPYVSVDTSGNGTVTLGNPDLKSLKSTNLDAAIEYYLPGQGIISLGLFYKKIKNPIFSALRVPTAAEVTAYGVTANAAVTQPLNADEATVKGMEANIQVQMTFLPSPLDGFGVSANYTYVDASADGVPLGGSATAGTRTANLSLQSRSVSTAQVFYEKYGFSARLAYSARSRYLLNLGAGTTAADAAGKDQYVDSFHSLDARAAYTFAGKAVTVFIEGANLTDADYRIYVGSANQMIENERYGRSVRGGFQLAF